MALTDHVAILLGHSLDVARLNKKKTRSDFYAQVAFPPAALNDLAALVSEVYPGISLNTLEVNIAQNAMMPKPFVGVPPDWYVVRMASAYAPELYAPDGVTRIAPNEARSKFFAGMRVRVHSTAWGWKSEFGKSGASFNLFGVMDAGQGGERLAIGGSNAAGMAFAAHANPNAMPQNGTGGAGSPFGGATNGSAVVVAPTPQSAASAGFGTATQSANPFQQNAGAAAQSGNPFA